MLVQHEQEFSLLEHISAGNGEHVELEGLPDVEADLLHELKDGGLISGELYKNGTWIKLTIKGAERLAALREEITFNAPISRWPRIIFPILGSLLLVGWFLFQNLAPTAVCPLIPFGEYLGKCMNMTEATK